MGNWRYFEDGIIVYKSIIWQYIDNIYIYKYVSMAIQRKLVGVGIFLWLLWEL